MESNSNYQFSATYSQIDLSTGYVLNIKAVQNQLAKTTDSLENQKFILFILDVSGSMSGTAIETCKQTLKSMLEYLHNELHNTNADLITFNNMATYVPLKDKNIDQCLNEIKKINAGGGTAFIPVFNEITKLVKKNPNEMGNLCMVFLSDGQAEKIQELEPKIIELKTFLMATCKSSEMHSLGFTSGHDAKVLTAVTQVGSGQGTFQYIKSSSEINQALEAVSGFFGASNFSAFLHFPGQDYPLKIHFEEVTTEGNGKSWSGVGFVELDPERFDEKKNEFRVIVKSKDTEEPYSLSLTKYEVVDPAQKIKMNLQFMNAELKAITQRLTNEKFSQKDGENLKVKIMEYRKKLEDFTRDTFKLKIMDRGPIFELIKDLTDYLGTFQSLIKDNFIGQLSNEQIAQLNSMAYRDVTKKALLKKLDKRAHKTVPIINEAFEKVKEISAKVDEKALSEKYAPLAESVGTCVLTCYNFIEAMKDQDCLCLTFDISRPEMAIADATKVTIKKVYPTIISANSFMDSIKFATSRNSQASGGFNESSQGSILKGVSSENITGALPFYICAEHWEIASLLMKPILGWDITLDPVGYNYFQKKVLPFMLLGHILGLKAENPNGEFSNRIYKFILDTCLQIIRDDMVPEFQGTMKDDVLKIHDNILKDGSVRTADSIQSNAIHLSHVFAFVQLGLTTKPAKEDLVLMIKYMMEDELRRRQEDWKMENVKDNLVSMLEIDIPKYTAIIEDKISNPPPEDSEKKEESKINEPKQGEEPNYKDYFDVHVEEFIKVNGFGEMNIHQKNAFKEYSDLYSNLYKNLFAWVKYFYPDDEFKLEDYSTFEKIGIDTPTKFLALYIQNKIQAKNADRKAAFTSGKHKNPWNEEEARVYLVNVYKNVICSKLKVKTKKAAISKNSTDDVTAFLTTDDLDEAAAVLSKGLTLGTWQYMQSLLRDESFPKALTKEKLIMIRDGQYKGQTFQFDFVMRKRFTRKMFKRVLNEYTYNEWKEIWFK